MEQENTPECGSIYIEIEAEEGYGIKTSYKKYVFEIHPG
jgi:hypothetical protein